MIDTTSPYKLYAAVFTMVVMVLGFTVVTSSRGTGTAPDQPGRIKFSHSTHVEGAGLQCTDCHEGAPTSKFSSENLLAKKANCQSCHEEQLEQNCTFCHSSDDPTTYVALRTPDRELIFSHELHIGAQNIACATCHTNLDAKTDFVGELVPAMATCTTCHDNVQAANSCESCHTNFAGLRPANHDRTDFMREHKRFVSSGDQSCTTCHTQETCNDCHAGGILTRVDKSGRDLTTPRSPRLISIDRGQGVALAKVHDLNFKFTHGIAAKGKASDCQSCHKQEQFCATCHAAGGNVNQLGFKPSWHAEAGFVTLGVGSGGGKHAQMARRDIESCASCHNAEAADPVCMTCHIDPDGVKGNDPKTHPRGFMLTTNGPWHSDPGASCYACHTDPNARAGGMKGKGFCSYCHR